MEQVSDPAMIRGREERIRVKREKRKIAYKAPNGMTFFIDTRPLEEGGEPIIRTKEAEIYSPSHKTHTLGNGRICLAASLRGWDLTRILLQCDSWARGYEIYKKTGYFPSSPREVFRRDAVEFARKKVERGKRTEASELLDHIDEIHRIFERLRELEEA
ncbi:MAG: hypothetical protein D6795_17840 [Deltaproteobacteria bacterium]|nr:MAG: hypothetical protein D6795_17840 [Deltaproteobacteria bacterium]